jgi:hypothetical protein
MTRSRRKIKTQIKAIRVY